MKLFYLLLFTLLLGFQASAQLDTLFWFVAPEVAQSHGDRPIVFRFATLATPATITISQPANPGFPPQIINLGANAAQTLDLTPWIDIIENKPANSVLNYGFKIKATAPIMAYYEVVTSCNCNPDIFALKGKNALGTNFIISAQTFLTNANYARSGFDIVATQSNTSITIVPSNDIVGHPAGIPFTIVLNQGETFSAEASNIAGNLHLSGSTVIANKPIAITIKDDSMSGAPYGGCADLMGDQTIPVPVTGKEYVTLKGYLNGPDKVYVVATQNNTQLTIDGINVGTLNATNLYVHTQSNPTAYIQADKPVYVLHTTGFGCEVGGAIVPPVVCTGSNTVAFVRSTNEFFAMNILVPAGGENSFTLNGSPANVGPGRVHLGEPHRRVPQRGLHRPERAVTDADHAARAAGLDVEPGRPLRVHGLGLAPGDERETVAVHVDHVRPSLVSAPTQGPWSASSACHAAWSRPGCTVPQRAQVRSAAVLS